MRGRGYVLRYGALPDSDLVARAVGALEQVTAASPAISNVSGRAGLSADLEHHRAVCLRSITTGAVKTVRICRRQQRRARRIAPSPSPAPRPFSMAFIVDWGWHRLLFIEHRWRQDGIRRVLADVACRAVSVLCPGNRQLSPRVRVFMGGSSSGLLQRASPRWNNGAAAMRSPLRPSQLGDARSGSDREGRRAVNVEWARSSSDPSWCGTTLMWRAKAGLTMSTSMVLCRCPRIRAVAIADLSLVKVPMSSPGSASGTISSRSSPACRRWLFNVEWSERCRRTAASRRQSSCTARSRGLFLDIKEGMKLSMARRGGRSS